MPSQTRIAIGLMSGTSADGVDAAVIETDGLVVHRTGAFLTVPYPDDLRLALLSVMRTPQQAEHDGLHRLTARVTATNEAACRQVMRAEGLTVATVAVVGMHGQTVLHRPQSGFTRQLGDGAALAAALGVAVVDGFRQADIAAGGQGAPLVPVFHQALAHALSGPLAVLNLGGVGNVTYLDGDTVLAFDTGPGNALLDDWMQRHAGLAYDKGGAVAGAGRVDQKVLSALLAHPYFDQAPPKSLDRNSFAADGLDELSLVDGAATLAGFTVHSVRHACEHLPRAPVRWLVAGGGSHNATLMDGLRAALGVPVEPVEAVGWHADALEAQAFGFLAVRSLRGLPLSMPSTTGVSRPMPGGVLHPCPALERQS